MGERRVLELWLCPECGDHSHFDRWKPEPPACLSHIPPVQCERARALVLDDAAIEALATALADTWCGRPGGDPGYWRERARAVLGLQEPRP